MFTVQDADFSMVQKEHPALGRSPENDVNNGIGQKSYEQFRLEFTRKIFHTLCLHCL